jgi:hypothetical protein
MASRDTLRDLLILLGVIVLVGLLWWKVWR